LEIRGGLKHFDLKSAKPSQSAETR
jgi:hypothetical protein